MELPPLQELKDNERTKYLALELERLSGAREEAALMLEDADMKAMAEEEIANITRQEEGLTVQILEILEK
jgi:hypothetical protein